MGILSKQVNISPPKNIASVSIATGKPIVKGLIILFSEGCSFALF